MTIVTAVPALPVGVLLNCHHLSFLHTAIPSPTGKVTASTLASEAICKLRARIASVRGAVSCPACEPQLHQ